MDPRAEQALALLQEPGVLTEELRRRLLELLRQPSEAPHVPYETFLAQADEDTLAEWVDGRVVHYSPASRPHQEVVGFLYGLLRAYVEVRGLGVVLPAPFQMRLSRSGREPDLLFVARPHLDRLHPTHLEGPADLVVEVVSPESAARDRGEKFYEYQEAGIPEYWLVDPHNRWAEFYQLLPTSRYRLAQEGHQGEYCSLVLPGFCLQIEWLWNPPPLLHALQQLGILG